MMNHIFGIKDFGHLNFQRLKILQEKNMVYGLPSITNNSEVCEECIFGKQYRISFSKQEAWRAKAPLELVHTLMFVAQWRPLHKLGTITSYYLLMIKQDIVGCILWVKNLKSSQYLKSDKSYLKYKVVILLKR